MSETILRPLTSNNAQNPYPDEMMLDLYNTDGVKNNIEHHEKTSQKNSKKPKDDQEKDEETTAILLEQNSSLPLPTMTETEMPISASESASSQAVKATTVSTSSSSSDGNGAIWGILGGLAGLGTIAGLAGGSKGGKSSGEPQAQHVPISPNPTPTITPTPPSTPAPEKTTIKIHYSDLKSDVYAGQTDVKFDYAPVRYVAKKINVSEEFIHNQYLKKFGANKITQNIEQAYARDSDNDGVVDFNDRNPNAWDVSERDLRMFASLAYEEESTLVSGINHKNQNAIQDLHFKDDSLLKTAHFLNQVDLSQEIVGYWEVLKSEGNLSNISGLNYTIFGNGKNTDGSYQNIVVAFRGMQINSPSDWLQGWKIKNGDLGADIDELEEIAKTVMKYQPSNVYSTGHSWGGYLAQFFAAYTMNQTQERANVFKHNSLFNPAALKQTDNLLKDEIELKEALNTTRQFVRTEYQDNSDKTNIQKSYKTNSYVIKGEWVSEGFPTIVNVGAEIVSFIRNPLKSIWNFAKKVFTGDTTPSGTSLSFYGLGTYENAQILKFKSGELWGKHNMTSFYEESRAELKEPFSKGYRMDKHYLHDDVDNDGLTDYQEKRLGTDSKQATVLKGKDTDKDGFSDRLEIELGSNWLDSKKIIDLKEYYSISAQEKQLLALVETHTEKGKFLGVQGMEMNAKVENNQLVYTPNASPLNLGITQDTEWQAFLQSGKNIIQGDSQNNVLEAKGEMQILYGASGNDILKTSTGVDILVGGSGQDTFVLKEESIKSGKMDFISDFSAEDKLNLSALKSIFNINHLNLKWSDLLTTQAQDNDALVWNEQEHTLSYQSKGSQNVHVLAKFDDDVDMARISAGLIG